MSFDKLVQTENFRNLNTTQGRRIQIFRDIPTDAISFFLSTEIFLSEGLCVLFSANNPYFDIIAHATFKAPLCKRRVIMAFTQNSIWVKFRKSAINYMVELRIYTTTEYTLESLQQ